MIKNKDESSGAVKVCNRYIVQIELFKIGKKTTFEFFRDKKSVSESIQLTWISYMRAKLESVLTIVNLDLI